MRCWTCSRGGAARPVITSRLDATLLGAQDIPAGVRLDRIAGDPGQPDGAGQKPK